jgi:hypothetical protein
MRNFALRRRISRRVGLLGAGAVLALGMVLPATALAAPSTTAALCDLTCVQNFGNLKIANRLTDLQALNSHVSNTLSAGYITSAQAGAIQSDVTTNTSGLNNLKTKLDGETTESAARQDVKSIYEQFRIYAVVLPRDYRLLHLDVALYLDGKLRALQPKIEQWIASAPASEQGQLNTLYSDYKAQLQEAEAQIDAAQGQLPVLTPQNFNNDNAAYKSAFQQYVNDDKTAHADLHKAAVDLHQMAKILKANQSASGGTPTATPTAA